MTDEPREALRRLEERLSQASDAAERLLAEAARSARSPGQDRPGGGRPGADRPPPAGWQMPRADEESDVRGPAAEFEMLLAAVGALRDLVPPEVLERLAAAVRELLLALRALLDFYLARLERPRSQPERVRDIPID
jgi:hypothetical protein